MSWQIAVVPKAQKEIAKLPSKDLEKVKEVIDMMSGDSFFGDIVKLGGEGKLWRRRVGSYRIFYELMFEKRIIIIHQVEHRSSKTY